MRPPCHLAAAREASRSDSREYAVSPSGQGWPLQSYLELAALPSAVPCARLHARLVVAEWGLDALSETAELIASELTTNAITATRSIGSVYPVRLWVQSDYSRTLIVVGDSSPDPPRRLDPAGDTEGGRGLLLVEALSSRWGWHAVHQRGTTKAVWAELRDGGASVSGTTQGGGRVAGEDPWPG